MLFSTIYESPTKTVDYYVTKEYEDRDGGEHLIMRVEQKENPEVFSEWRLPSIFCYKSYGFTETDLLQIADYIKTNSALIWNDWRLANA